MKLKYIFLDESFIFAIWPSLLGFISQNFITLIFMGIIWSINDTYIAFLEMALSKTNQLIFFSILFGLFGAIIFAFSLVIRKTNPLSLPIMPISNLREIKKHQSQDETDREDTFYFRYMIPSLTLLVGILFFVVPYISGVPWEKALLNAILAILPFHLGFLALYMTLIGLETILLFLRYTVNSSS